VTAPPQILVAGIGNIFLGDDAFGSEVARRLMRRPQPPHVRVADFGIRGLDLVYALLDGCDTAILIDAVPRPGEPPGTLFLLEPPVRPNDESSPPLIEAHSMDPMKVLRTAAAMGAKVGRVLIVGCQPSSPQSPDDDGCDTPMGMSAAVTAAVDEAVAMVESLVERLSGNASHQPSTDQPLEVVK
jgi:hydrogenase maturation protease